MTIHTRTNLPARHRRTFHQYVAIDGWSGAHLLAALDGYRPYLQSVASPRHADLLIIVAPISRKLVPAIAEIAGSLPQPAHILLIEQPSHELVERSGEDIADGATLFSGVRRVIATSVEDVFHAMTDAAPWPLLAVKEISTPDAETIQLPAKQEQEMATELAVLSLGPIQPFTAGPLRLFLICDGEQVFSVQVESGYAHRGIAQAMQQSNWQQSLNLACLFDPLVPVASQLIYVKALEQLQHWQPISQVVSLREAALALERAQNHLWWVVRFLRLLADVQLSDRAYQLAMAYDICLAQLWQQQLITWVLPQWQGNVEYNASAISHVQLLASAVETLTRSIEHHRWLNLRTRHIGVLEASYLNAHGVSGPVLQASEQGQGDVQSRLVARLHNITSDMRKAADIVTQKVSLSSHNADWNIPAGDVQVTLEGPRGQIGLHLKSDGGEKPAYVEWQSPSSVLLPLLPELLAGQILADAEIILASLDLAMAEVDG